MLVKISVMKKAIRYFLPLLIIALIVSCSQEVKEKKAKKKRMKIEKEVFGKIDGDTAFLFTMTNDQGMIVKITNYGGIVTSIIVPDREGKKSDVVLGFEDLQSYIDGHPYFGCIVGRYANRIANGKFNIDEKEYTLAQNNGINHLHGGIKGFDKVLWDVSTKRLVDSASVRLHYTSPDGEEGYPGNLKCKVTYTLTNDNELIIEYKALTDKSTPVNLTHHSYFNLGGTEEDCLNHEMQIDANKFVVVNENLIPTGELKDVAGTPMDFTSPQVIGERIDQVDGGYDHTYVLNNDGKMQKIAVFSHPDNGRYVEVYSSEPGVQFYSGNFLDGSLIGKNHIIYKKHYGFCLETQHFPDSPNQPDFPSTILRPGEEYGYTTIYKFLTK